MKSIKGNQAALFKLKAKIVGEKRPSQEAVSMVDPDNKELLFEPERIKEASVKYLTNLLTNRNPSEGYEMDIKVKEIIHNVRMNEEIEDDESFSEDDFKNLMKILKLKNKEKYQFILKSGTDYLRVLYSLFKKIWDNETKPKQWEKTVAHQ